MTARVLGVFSLFASLACIADAETPKVVRMPMGRNAERSTLQKRGSSYEVDLGNAYPIGIYYVNASVGTPPQLVQLQLDTGSSDVWMFSNNACPPTSQTCEGGTFDPTQSTTFTNVPGGQGAFEIHYETPGSGVFGDYIADTYQVGGIKLKQLQMGLAQSATNVTTGIMGIAFDSDESAASNGTVYPSVVDQMVTQGVINSRAYSLWLDDLQASTGSVLFGGIDTDKFQGTLAALPIQPDVNGDFTSFTVSWTGLALNDPTNGSIALTTSAFVSPAVLDSGTTLTIIPADLYTQLASFSGVVSTDIGDLVPCSIANYQGTLDFSFGGTGGPVIQVPFSELAIPETDNNGNPLMFQDGTAACGFGLAPQTEGLDILFGDTFLRSAYVVYDLDQLEIGLAQTVFNTTKSNVQVIPASASGGAQFSATLTGPQATQTGSVGNPQGTTAAVTATGVPTKAPGFGGITGVSTMAVGKTGSATGSAATASSTKASAAGALRAIDAAPWALTALIAVGFAMFVA